jgi:phage gp45-like
MKSGVRLIRGRISGAKASSGKNIRGNVSGLSDEKVEDVEIMAGYGFSSVPKDGAECIAVQFGHRTVVVSGADRRIAPDMENGDVAIHTDKEQYVILKDSGGIEIRTSGNVTVYAALIRLGGNTLLPGVNGVVTPQCTCAYAGLHVQGSATVMAKG